MIAHILSEALTSSKISLWRRTPLRMFAIVIPIMTTIAPITARMTKVSTRRAKVAHEALRTRGKNSISNV